MGTSVAEVGVLHIDCAVLLVLGEHGVPDGLVAELVFAVEYDVRTGPDGLQGMVHGFGDGARGAW